MSALGGGAADLDEKEGYEVDFLSGPREDGDDRVMALYTVLLALNFAGMSDRDFLSHFADEIGKVMQAYPVTEQEIVAKQLISLFRRYGQTVSHIVSDAIRKHSDDITRRTLPTSSLMALFLAGNETKVVSASQVDLPKLPDPKPDVSQKEIGERTSKILLAIDDTNRIVRIWGGAALNGDTIFPIMKRLVDLRIEDRQLRLASKNYRGLRGKQLADELQLSDANAVGAAIKRARDEFAEVFRSLEGVDPYIGALIQNIVNNGYRLNPDVEIVSMEEFSKL